MTERETYREPDPLPTEAEMDLMLAEWEAWANGAFSEVFPGGYGESY